MIFCSTDTGMALKKHIFVKKSTRYIGSMMTALWCHRLLRLNQAGIRRCLPMARLEAFVVKEEESHSLLHKKQLMANVHLGQSHAQLWQLVQEQYAIRNLSMQPIVQSSIFNSWTRILRSLPATRHSTFQKTSELPGQNHWLINFQLRQLNWNSNPVWMVNGPWTDKTLSFILLRNIGTTT